MPPASVSTGTDAAARSSAAASCASAPSGEVSTIGLPAGSFASAVGEARADREPGAGNMALRIAPAQVEIDHRDARRRPTGRAGPSHRCCGAAAASRPRTRGTCAPADPIAVGRAGDQHRNVRQPICFSQDAVMVARTPLSSTSTTRAPQVATCESVSCTSWPPGAERAPRRWPASYSSGVRTSST